MPLLTHGPNRLGIDHWRPSLVDTALLRPLDPVPLPLATDVVLELGDCTEDCEHQLASAGGGVDTALLEAAEGCPCCGELLDEPVKVGD